MSSEIKKAQESEWLDKNLPKYNMLKESALSVINNLLVQKNIDFLSIYGRVKDKQSCLEKIERKKYQSIIEQMTDLSGIRIIVYFESDVVKVGELVREVFNVDEDNSGDKIEALEKDKLGYRSVHYVCEFDVKRCLLPEFKDLGGLKFEIQIRTVLQHAWAELAHDRGYKFSGKLPLKLERKLNLYSGMLELADNGFDEISKEITKYKDELDAKSQEDIYNVRLDSISIKSFVNKWCEDNKISLINPPVVMSSLSELLNELESVGVFLIVDLKNIIPENYVELYNSGLIRKTNIFGLVRDWIILYDHKRLLNNCDIKWVVVNQSIEDYKTIAGQEKGEEIFRDFEDFDKYVDESTT
mgnify:CR=1 FL=1|jgi:ppGpp synthetase/RelA/SpoT-type nucleotidyltranferase|tara:strand:+ start:826 stop:1893 length:1068 start_codon:yes stop_codon:yes gene_type:complete